MRTQHVWAPQVCEAAGLAVTFKGSDAPEALIHASVRSEKLFREDPAASRRGPDPAVVPANRRHQGSGFKLA
ncbi:hypothetical protein GCM10011577_18910 [Pseudarthrobacter polychromogenes]|uniref:Uncharacterized protein n=1 Tax=Pseudarthrobacter polychromogenes TaxID=1676 RepID=A0ABQ1XKB8_9MICC|nr:hypothetical protein GCM10011577_18910 [Pseudarthrobacter polychromogenes]